MHLIIGGAYQGKLDYVKKKFLIEDSLVYTCKNPDECETPQECLDLLRLTHTVRREELKAAKALGNQDTYRIKAINNLEHFTLACAENDVDAEKYLRGNKDLWKDRIIIITDISQGIVPADPVQRKWREQNGRAAAYLAGKAETVTRIFCGLPQTLKE